MSLFRRFAVRAFSERKRSRRLLFSYSLSAVHAPTAVRLIAEQARRGSCRADYRITAVYFPRRAHGRYDIFDFLSPGSPESSSRFTKLIPGTDFTNSDAIA